MSLKPMLITLSKHLSHPDIALFSLNSAALAIILRANPTVTLH